MAIDSENRRIAVVRRGFEDGIPSPTIIEIWNIKYVPFVEQKIYESDDEPALIEAVCWGDDSRLFSCGGDGFVNEYDLLKNCVKHRYDTNCGALWSLAINASRENLVFGSEDGCISIIDLAEDGLGEVHRLCKMSKRVLSLTWMKNGDRIIAGCQGLIAIYDHKTRKLLEKIEMDKNCMVWSLATLNEITVSGDSDGYTSFWDTSTGSLISRHQSHRSHVLTVFVSADGLVYSSGVDPVIAQFDGNTTKPMPPIYVHTHDVRAVVVDKGGFIYSGGLDIDLVRTITQPKNVAKFTLDMSECFDLWADILSVRYSKVIELFSINTSDHEVEPVDLPVKLASIKSKKSIISAAVNCNWVVYTTFDDIFFVSCQKELVKVRHSLTFNGAPDKMSFVNDEAIAVATPTKLHVISLKNGNMAEIKAACFDHRITSLSTCPNSIALALSNNELIYLPKSDWTPISVSKLPSVPTAMSFHPYLQNKLYVATSNKVICKYNLEHGHLKLNCEVDFTKLEFDHYFRGIAFTAQSVLIYTSSGLYSFDPNDFSFKTRIPDYKTILSVRTISDERHQQIVLIELPQDQFIKLLPAAFMKKIFGAE